jgi:phosphodiesterase/alkaline phosphatase D-like protein
MRVRAKYLQACIGIVLAVYSAGCKDGKVAGLSDGDITVAVLPAQETLRPGESKQLTAIVRAKDGRTLDRPVTWRSSDANIVQVSTTGIVTGVRPGTATITAEAAEKTGTAQLAVIQPAPTAETMPASNLTSTSAELNGSVNPNGGATTASFEWGSTAALGGTCSPPVLLAAGNQATPVRCTVNGLTPGATLYFRVSAQNSGGTTQGQILVFTTPVPAPTAVTLAATSISANGAVLNGTVNPNGNSTTAVFEWGTTAALGTQCTPTSGPGSATTPVPLSCVLSGLQSGTTVHFRVSATNAGGTVRGAILTFTTTSLLPPAVTTLPATNVTSTSAIANASVNPNGVSTTATIQWGTSQQLGSQCEPPVNAGSGNAAFAFGCTFSGLQPGMTIYYRAVASSAGGAAQGSILSFTTTNLPPTPPPTVQTLAATAITSSGGVANGTVNPNGSSTSATFDYGTTPALGQSCSPTINLGSGNAPVPIICTFTGFSAGTTIYYRVRATNAGGTATGAILSFTTTSGFAPIAVTLAPTNVTNSSGQANGTVNPRGSSTTATFQYGTSTALGQSCAPLNIGSGSTSVDINCVLTPFAPGTTVYYRVTATNANGTSTGAMYSFTTTTPPVPTVVTQAATGVTMTGGTANGTVNPNGFTTTANFEYGLTTALGSFCGSGLNIGSGTTPIAVQCALTGASPGTTVYYRVIATNVNGSANGAIFSFTTPTSGPVIAGAAGVLSGQVRWSAQIHVLEAASETTSVQPATRATGGLPKAAGIGARTTRLKGVQPAAGNRRGTEGIQATSVIRSRIKDPV